MTTDPTARILAEILSYDLTSGTVQLRALDGPGQLLEAPLPSRLAGGPDNPRTRQALDEVMRALNPPGWKIVLEDCASPEGEASGVMRVLPARFGHVDAPVLAMA